MWTLLLPWLLSAGDVVESAVYSVGISRVEITPSYPVRLHGFGFRKTPSEGVKQKIWARALAIGDRNPFVLLVVDSLGVPASMTEALARRLAPLGVTRERVCISATHTHTAPMLRGVAPTIFGSPIPPDHSAAIDRYTEEFSDAIEMAARKALTGRQPRTLSYGVGEVGFAVNRRTKGGPVDRDFAVLFVKETDGRIAAIFGNYSCHCVTMSFNKVSGDWAGCGSASFEAANPGTVAMIGIGCGADANPNTGVTGDKWQAAELQGREIHLEIDRLSKGFLTPIQGELSSASQTLTLPLQTPPAAEIWKKRAGQKDASGFHAQTNALRMAAGEKLRTEIPYEIRTWRFGNSLAMTFLPGEVVVDYSIRLKRELDGRRLWINAYSNDSPCYIPSERILNEGGYEGGDAMIYYDLPTPLMPGLENKIVDAVKNTVGKRFLSPFDAKKTATQPRSAQQSLSAIRVSDEWTVELAAAEPMVVDPCAVAFGPDGKVWVAEINDYPSGPRSEEPGGQIRMLEDRNHDGAFDRATVFLTSIPYPTGVTVWRKGLLICAAPDILYAEDLDGDGKADKIEKLFSGFATHNFHARVNSLEYGLDGWIHGSGGLFGGSIRNKAGKVVSLGSGDFRCQPDLGVIEPAAGQTQQGRVRSDFGDWFGCDNTNLGAHYPLTASAIGRNPYAAAPHNHVRLPSAEAARLFPQANLQMFALSGPVGQATAAGGIGIYRDSALSESLQGDFFTPEPVHLAVHRMKLEAVGATFVGKRPADETGREFLSSSDPWFRPVQVRTAPDGDLWVVDLYRYVIEHPMWIPPEELVRFDLRAGSTMGRIYRVTKKGTKRAAMPRLDHLDVKGLATAFRSSNGTLRDLAMCMLWWKPSTEWGPAIPELSLVATQDTRPECRAQAFAALGVMKRIPAEILQAGLRDAHPGVRRQAVKIAADLFAKETWAMREVVRSAQDTAHGRLRLEAIESLHAFSDSSGEIESALASAWTTPSDEFTQAAAESSLRAESVRGVLTRVLRSKNIRPETAARLATIAVRFSAVRGLEFLSALPANIDEIPPWRFAVVNALLTTVDTKSWDGPLRIAEFRSLPAELQAARKVMGMAEKPITERAAALELLGRTKTDRVVDAQLLTGFLVPSQPMELQSTALRALTVMSEGAGFKPILDALGRLGPTMKMEAVRQLSNSIGGQQALLAAIADGRMKASELDAAAQRSLVASTEESVKRKATELFAAVSGDRKKVIDVYRAESVKKGDAGRGRLVYLKHCSGCHRLGGDGFAVGPDLATVALKPAEYLLAEILDPSRNLDARYVGYTALLATGQTLTGLVVQETPTSLVLSCQDGKSHSLLRSQIDRLASGGKSLMPEGLEQQIPPAVMADLLTFLTQQTPPAKWFHGNTPTVVQQSETGRLFLPARFASIRGPTMTFAVPAYALEYWQNADDQATWEIETNRAGSFDVVIDYSCHPDAAGNILAASIRPASSPKGNAASIQEKADRVLSFTVPSTGAWSTFQKSTIGKIDLPVGRTRFQLRAGRAPIREAVCDLRSVELTPVPLK